MSKFKVLDLFCGAGGLSYGFKLAGFDIVGGVDFNSSAMETHKKNLNSKFEFCGDIKEITEEIINRELAEVDVIIGGPPCQGFSAANRYDREADDPRNKLFFEFLKFITILKPKAFVIENVKEILTKNNGFAKSRILEITEKLGYHVNFAILNAVEYGVPQNRRRAFFVGIRKDYKKQFYFEDLIKTKPHLTVYDAIADLCYPEGGIKNSFLSYAKDSEIIFNHIPKSPCERVVKRMTYVPQGGNWKDVPTHLWEKQRDNRHSSAYKRLSFFEPSITVDTGHMNYFHPIEHRVPTVRESARLQSFPDSFVFCGNQGEQYKQVGNAVPPLLGKAIAIQIMKILSGRISNEE